MGFLNRLKEGLNKSRQVLASKIENLVSSGGAIDDDIYDELEEILIGADAGVDTSAEIVSKVRQEVKKMRLKDKNELRTLLKEQIITVLGNGTVHLNMGGPPTVILVIGVNGAGKTTTIAKLAHLFKSDGNKVMLAAGDTFRAAAVEQLEIWGQRLKVEVIKHGEGADPSAVAFDALQAARARKADVLIVDTAGRLHTKSNLMEELKKMRRVLSKNLPGAPHEVLLVLDATTGQNALSQAELFGSATGVTGIVLTKLDSTAKGGIVIAIRRALDIPVKFIGIGEGINDFQPFNAQEFTDALLGN